MKLVYLWIEKFRSIERQGFSFDSEFNVVYETGTEIRNLHIYKTENKAPNYGSKVINITAMVGMNGSGKTNILDLIGLKMKDRFNYANLEAEYFIVYQLEGNQFVIEGNKFDKLRFLHVPERVSNFYSFIASLGNDNKLTFQSFLQEHNQDSLAVINNFRYSYNRRYWSSLSFHNDQEPWYFFQRFAFRSIDTGIYNKYRFMRNANEIFESDSSYNFFQVGEDTHIVIKPTVDKDRDSELILKYKESDYFNFFKLLQSDTMSTEETKNYFVISLLENIIHDLFKQCVRNIPQDKKILQEKINKISLRKGSRPQAYLLKVIQVLGEVWDQYISLKHPFYECIKEMYEYIKKLPQETFRKKQIIIKIYDRETKEISSFLNYLDIAKFDQNNSAASLFQIDINSLSSGEETFLNLFSTIYRVVTSVENAENTTGIILLDEPDSFMHPEWSRILVSKIIELLEGISGGFKDYQVILTTHSPFIISDLPKQNIIAIRKDYDTGKSIGVPLYDFPQTFASNIYTLLSHEFFMTDTIGEFAKKKITNVLQRLKTIISGADSNLEEKNEIKKWIQLIGDPIIKSKMLQLLEDAFPLSKRESQLVKLQRLREEIAELEREIGNPE